MNWSRNLFSGQPFAYLLMGDVTVPDDASLQVSPGVVVKLQGANLSVQGKLEAKGAYDQQIVFTSCWDNSIQPHTMPDNATPHQGDWGAVSFENGSKGTLAYCRVRYGGANQSMLSISGASPVIKLCSFENCQMTPIFCQGDGNPILGGNHIYSCGHDAMECGPSARPVAVSNTFRQFGASGVKNDQVSGYFKFINNIIYSGPGGWAISHSSQTLSLEAAYQFNSAYNTLGQYTPDSGVTSQPITILGETNRYENPRFSSAALNAYLQTGSPCLATGVAASNRGAPPFPAPPNSNAYRLNVSQPADGSTCYLGSPLTIQISVRSDSGILKAGMICSAYLLYKNGMEMTIGAFTDVGGGTYSTQTLPLDNTGSATLFLFARKNGSPETAFNCVAINVAQPAPSAPASPNPADGATRVPIGITLDWSDCDWTESYDLYLWKASQPKPTTPTAANLDRSDYTPPMSLERDTLYSWQVVAKSQGGNTTGLVWSFATETAAPDTGTVIVSVKPSSATWSLTDSDGGVTTGTGNGIFPNMATGMIEITWMPLSNFDLPTSNPMLQSLDRGTTIAFEGRYTLPINVLRALLAGKIANPTLDQIEAADVNRDGVIDIADLISLIAIGR
ncbi:MAG: right-handed parallel beta-helix repeat-containing protein [Candidatus Sumerlaeota bacterium]|nr:right-handed parallel beta-helix repeat-containing protein [Candidatus Sumerlaeota bacterium]